MSTPYSLAECMAELAEELNRNHPNHKGFRTTEWDNKARPQGAQTPAASDHPTALPEGG